MAPGRGARRPSIHRRSFALTGGEISLRSMRTRFLAAVAGRALCWPRRRCRPAAQTPQPMARAAEEAAACGCGDRIHNLDFLFGALKAAPDEDTAKAIEQRIWALWVVSRSDTTNLLMTRVKTAIEQKDTDLAHQAARRHRQDQAGLCRSLEPARHALLHEEGLRPLARRHPRSAQAASRAISARCRASA